MFIVKKLKKEESNDEQKYVGEIEYLLYQQQKYGKLNYQKIIDSNNEIKKLVQPDRAIQYQEIKGRQNQKVKSVKSCKWMNIQFEYYFNRNNVLINQINYAEEYSPPRFPQQKFLAIINQDESMNSKQRKIQLKLKQKEFRNIQNEKQVQNKDQENTMFIQSQPQDSKKGKGGKIKKTIKIKKEAIKFQKQKDDIKNQKNVIIQEKRKIQQEMKIQQDKHHNLIKSAAEAEPKIKANKDFVNERDERLNGLKIDQKKKKNNIKKLKKDA
ncbi:unnamed protein product [Paramecium pentaurelia]|uniref:Uncharacterized protein n=1 Tax=Paramecium pentaurelia TaxID=43138 RepID=A0A8S1TUI0_9CILI|nr:unnamed protein product [Paramecium pentaurelia]